MDTGLAGESLNVSSKGLIFNGPDVFLPGQTIEVSVDWPVLLRNCIPLTLVTEGTVTRCSGNLTAMRFTKFEFRPYGEIEWTRGRVVYVKTPNPARSPGGCGGEV